MRGEERIRTAVERSVKALELRPGFGQGTAVTKVRVVEGLECEVTEGAWRFAVDMSEKTGGTGKGPNPGILARAALGSCLAVGYMMHAARWGVRIDALEVDVEADYDSRGMYGVGTVRPGYEAMRYVVRVASPEEEETVLALLDDADAHSDFLEIFRNGTKVERRVEVHRGAPA